MCGIAGALTKKSDLPLDAMLSCISHRGPDDSGTTRVQSRSGFVFLGNNRLAIIDLSSGGHQPMSDERGTVTIVYNGELYNYRELKKELQNVGHSFFSQSDTEVVLKAYAQWKETCLDHFNGMFAFAVWDAQEERLFLARDHAGQKPLYYAHLTDGTFLFGSEIKSILASGLVEPCVKSEELPGYLMHLRVHAPATLFKNIKKLPAGHCLTLRDGSLAVQRWWHPIAAQKFNGSFEQAVETTRSLFKNAVQRTLIADVPVGAFLSGGLDSSMIVTQATQLTRQPFTTFTTGFRDEEFLTSRVMAHHLKGKINYHEIFLEKPNPSSLLQKIVWHLDEPIADPAAVNAYLICQQARAAGIKVLLSGMGADEVFAGYNHHRVTDLLTRFSKIPFFCKLLGTTLPPLTPLFPHNGIQRYIQRRGTYLSFKNTFDQAALTTWFTENEVRDMLPLNTISLPSPLESKVSLLNEAGPVDPLTQILYADCATFLAEHNLMYTDKMSMAHSCEVRSPFLDRELMEYAFSLPTHFKISRGHGKYILKKSAPALLPPKIIWQKKSGFSAPLQSWRAELFSLTRELFTSSSSVSSFFDQSTLNNLLKEPSQKGSESTFLLYTLLTFAVWHRIFIEKREWKHETSSLCESPL